MVINIIARVIMQIANDITFLNNTLSDFKVLKWAIPSVENWESTAKFNSFKYSTL